MELAFTKRDGRADELKIVRSSGATETVACPKQGIIPHDMVHFAVESGLAHRGFLSLVRDGQAADFEAGAGEGDEAVERLVETFQAEMWGGCVSAADLLTVYQHACYSRGHGVAEVSIEDVEAIRGRLDDLTERWRELPVNEMLVVSF